jgi:tetratricopeptide (TPR) repeat protein
MKRIKTVLSFCLAVATVAGAAKIEVTFTNGAARTLSALVVRDGTLVLTGENLAVPLASVKTATFSFDNLSPETCDKLLNASDYEAAVRVLSNALEPVKGGWIFPGNIDLYLGHTVRANFWTGRFGELRNAATALQTKKSSFVPLAELYQILSLIEEGQAKEAEALFRQIKDPEKISAPMTEYIQAKLAVSEQDYNKALQHLARVVVFHSRDPEWMPAAAFLEGTIYKKTGRADAAAHIVEELKRAYPETYWGVRAEDLKIESVK